MCGTLRIYKFTDEVTTDWVKQVTAEIRKITENKLGGSVMSDH